MTYNLWKNAFCPDCRKRITRKQTAERMRKMRANVTR